MLTLWDLISPVLKLLRPGAQGGRSKPVRPASRVQRPRTKRRPRPLAPGPGLFEVVQASKPGRPARSARLTARERYARVAQDLLREHGIKVRRWRKNMSGVAWTVKYNDGSVARFIEAPRPVTPLSTSILLHEIGHHAIGFDRYKPRCLEEYHAWRWSLEAMERHGLAITDRVRHRVSLSLWYAVDKARRRGIKELPAELLAYQTRPAKPKRERGGG